MLPILKSKKEEYRRFIGYDYYLILGQKDYHDVFMKDFFKFLHDF